MGAGEDRERLAEVRLPDVSDEAHADVLIAEAMARAWPHDASRGPYRPPPGYSMQARPGTVVMARSYAEQLVVELGSLGVRAEIRDWSYAVPDPDRLAAARRAWLSGIPPCDAT